MNFTLLFVAAMLKLVHGIGLIEYFERCGQWLVSNGENCDQATRAAPFAFSFGSNYSTPSEDEICCQDGTGCFSIKSGTPYDCHLHLPRCMDEMKPEFLLYTPQKNQQVQMIDYFNLDGSAESLEMQLSELPLFIIVHGFGGDWPKPWLFNMKDGLNALGNNVIIVRWTNGANDPYYFQAVSNTRTVGAAIARVIKALVNNKKASLQNTTIIGFSLGGHVAGYAGRNLTGLGRILAIDPAGPMFQCMKPETRLDPTDADFVQAIHTNGDYFFEGGCGTLQRFGHMDVYFNGGIQQPGCPLGKPQVFRGLTDLNFGAMVESVSCSHNRAPELLAEIIDHAAFPETTCQFIGFPCASPTDWYAGRCFECSAGKCPKIGYFTGLKNRLHGKFLVNSLSDNSTIGGFCGRQLLVTVSSLEKVKGNISVVFKMPGQNDTGIRLQELHDVLNAQEPKSGVMVLPYDFQTEEVELVYHRSPTWIIGGAESWQLQSLSVQLIDGTRFSYRGALLITDAIPQTIRLKKS